MTISAVTSNDIRPQFTGDNVTTAFPFSPPLNRDEDMTVLFTDLTTMVETTGVLNVDYTISGLPLGGPYTGGVTVNIVPAPDTNTQVTLFRNTVQDQTQSYIAKSAFPAVITEQILDKIIMIIQELEEKYNLALQLAASAVGISPVLPAPEAGKALIGDPTETMWINSSIDLTTLAADIAAAQAAAVSASAAAAAAAASAAAAAASAASVQSPDVDTVQTTDATPTTIKSIATTNNSVGWIKTEVLSKDAGSNDGAMYRRTVKYENDGGTVTVDTSDDVTLESQSNWDFDVVVSGTDVLLQVTGEAGKTIDWESETLTKELT